jgi:uncharacterized protein involved in exopolysaccharide biosynthesis
MEVIAIVEVLRRHARLIILLCVMTTFAGYAISFFSPLIPEKYDASVIVLVRPHHPIQIEPNSSGREFLDFPVAQTPVVETASKTYIQMIQSPALIGEVVRELKLDEKPSKREPEGATMLDRLSGSVKAFYDEIDPYFKDAVAIIKYGRVLRDDPFEKTVKAVIAGLTLKSYEDTYAFEVKFSSEDPNTSAAVANAIARLFIQYLEKIRSSEAEDAATRLKIEVERSWKRLVEAQESLRAYKAAHGVFLYQPEYAAKLRVIGDLTFELAKLDESMAAGTFEAKTYAMKRERLLKSLDEQRGDLASLPTVERDLQLLQADVAVASTTYAIVAKELKNAEIRSDPLPEARLISAATVPKLPSSPHRGIILIVSLLTGLMVGVGLAFFLEYIGRSPQKTNDAGDFDRAKGIGAIANVGHV